MFNEGKGSCDVVGNYTSSQAIIRVVGAIHYLLKVFEFEDALDRAEDLGKVKKKICKLYENKIEVKFSKS